MAKLSPEMLAKPFSGLLPFPQFDSEAILADDGNRAEISRLKAEGHAVYVRKRDDGTYQIVDGGKIIA
jgi:hypothetical protein